MFGHSDIRAFPDIRALFLLLKERLEKFQMQLADILMHNIRIQASGNELVGYEMLHIRESNVLHLFEKNTPHRFRMVDIRPRLGIKIGLAAYLEERAP